MIVLEILPTLLVGHKTKVSVIVPASRSGTARGVHGKMLLIPPQACLIKTC